MINFIENDIQLTKDALVKGYEEIMKTKISEGDPMNDFISWVTYIFTLSKENINFVGNMNLLRFSTGNFLEAIGDLVGVQRIAETKAKATIRYSFSKSFDSVITLPKGHKIAAENIYFELNSNTNLEIGQTELIGEVSCTIPGAIGNSFQKGEINKIVNDTPFLYKVENITISAGGMNEENDESLRKRIQLKPTSFSTAGPIQAYRYYALESYKDINDAYIYTDTPGTVNIVPLLRDGIIPSEEILKIVKDKFSDDIRPFTDNVIISSPEVSSYNIKVNWWGAKNKITLVTPKVEEALKKYILWQKEKLGRNINPNKLVQYLLEAGAERVDVISPTYTILDKTFVAQENELKINYQGDEDE